MRQEREREDTREWDFTYPSNGWMKCGPVCGCQSSKASGESRSELVSVSRRGPMRGPPEVGSGEEPPRLWWLFPPGFQRQNVRLVQKRENKPGSRARKGKFIRGKRKGDGS